MIDIFTALNGLGIITLFIIEYCLYKYIKQLEEENETIKKRIDDLEFKNKFGQPLVTECLDLRVMNLEKTAKEYSQHLKTYHLEKYVELKIEDTITDIVDDLNKQENSNIKIIFDKNSLKEQIQQGVKKANEKTGLNFVLDEDSIEIEYKD